jgi:hypothetical protein
MIDNSEAQELHERIGAAIETGDTSGLARARELAAVVVSDTELIPGTALREDNLAVWFTPSAIVDAFDGEENELAQWVRGASEAQLASIGEACLSADSLWRLFHELIEMFVRDDMEAERSTT